MTQAAFFTMVWIIVGVLVAGLTLYAIIRLAVSSAIRTARDPRPEHIEWQADRRTEDAELDNVEALQSVERLGNGTPCVRGVWEDRAMSPDDMLTIRIPRWAWQGIVEGIERWTGRRLGDIEILDAAEVIDPEPHVSGLVD